MCKCWSTHHLVYMLAGAAFWEALTHLLLEYSGALPLSYWGFMLTKQNNLIVMGVALLIGFILLYSAKKSGHSNCSSC